MPISFNFHVSHIEKTLQGFSEQNLNLIHPATHIEKKSLGTFETAAFSETTIKLPASLEGEIVFENKVSNEQLDFKIQPHSPFIQGILNSNEQISYVSSPALARTLIVGERPIQIITSLANNSAPLKFSYNYGLKVGDNFELQQDGSVHVIDSFKKIQNVIPAPWAKDAVGKRAITYFTVNGKKLTQHIRHDSSTNLVYPVYADSIIFAPWVVKCLVETGINFNQINHIASLGSPLHIASAYGHAANRCVLGK